MEEHMNELRELTDKMEKSLNKTSEFISKTLEDDEDIETLNAFQEFLNSEVSRMEEEASKMEKFILELEKHRNG